jgi:hypothetical protein
MKYVIDKFSDLEIIKVTVSGTLNQDERTGIVQYSLMNLILVKVKMKHMIFFVVLAMVICSSNAVAAEWQTRSKNTMTALEAKAAMKVMRATDPDLRYPKDKIDIYDECGHKDIVVWGYYFSLSGNWIFSRISVCDKPQEDRYHQYYDRESLETAKAYLFPIKCDGPQGSQTCIYNKEDY